MTLLCLVVQFRIKGWTLWAIELSYQTPWVAAKLISPFAGLLTAVVNVEDTYSRLVYGFVALCLCRDIADYGVTAEEREEEELQAAESFQI